MGRVLKINSESIQEAALIVRSGGLIAYPTDTVYGLGCDPFNETALERLLRAKGRANRALPILIDSGVRARAMGKFNWLADCLIDSFWPGPLTVVVPKAVELPSQVTARSNEVGLRMPGLKDTLELVRTSGGRIVGTSANLAGAPPSTTADEVVLRLGTLVDLVLDGGTSSPGVESTVVRIRDDEVEILRERAIPGREILNLLEKSRTSTVI